MAHFKVDMARLKEVGGGSLTEFAKRNGITRSVIYHINGRNHFRSGSEAQRTSEVLMRLGIGKWVNDEEEAS